MGLNPVNEAGVCSELMQIIQSVTHQATSVSLCFLGISYLFHVSWSGSCLLLDGRRATKNEALFACGEVQVVHRPMYNNVTRNVTFISRIH